MSERRAKDNDEIVIVDETSHGFTVVDQWILNLPLRSIPKMVFIALKSFSGYSEIRPSIRTVAKRAGCSRSTVKRSIQLLEKKQLIHVRQGKRPDGGDGANIYVLRNPHRRPQVQTEPGVNLSQTPGQGGPGGRFDLNLQKNKNNKTKETHTCDRVFAENLSEVLTGGFSSIDRSWLVSQIRQSMRPVKEIMRDLDRLCWQYGKADAPEVRTPEALVLKAVREGWAEPEGFIPVEERERRARALKAATAQARAAERTREEVEARRWESAKEEFLNLSDAEQKRYLARFSWMRNERREAAAIGAYMRETGI